MATIAPPRRSLAEPVLANTSSLVHTVKRSCKHRKRPSCRTNTTMPHPSHTDLTTFDSTQITQSLLSELADFLNSHFGTLPNSSTPAVHCDAASFAASFISPSAGIVTYRVDTKLVGFVVFSRWLCDSSTVLWISLIVVHHQYRHRSVATVMLVQAKQYTDQIVGLSGFHPFAFKAAANVFKGIHTHLFILASHTDISRICYGYQ